MILGRRKADNFVIARLRRFRTPRWTSLMADGTFPGKN